MQIKFRDFQELLRPQPTDEHNLVYSRNARNSRRSRHASSSIGSQENPRYNSSSMQHESIPSISCEQSGQDDAMQMMKETKPMQLPSNSHQGTRKQKKGQRKSLKHSKQQLIQSDADRTFVLMDDTYDVTSATKYQVPLLLNRNNESGLRILSSQPTHNHRYQRSSR